MRLPIQVTLDGKRHEKMTRMNHVCMPMFPESILVPNSVSSLFGHKDGADGGVSIPKLENATTSYGQEATHPPRLLATA